MTCGGNFDTHTHTHAYIPTHTHHTHRQIDTHTHTNTDRQTHIHTHMHQVPKLHRLERQPQWNDGAVLASTAVSMLTSFGGKCNW